MYHNSKHKSIFRILDHIFIYVAIAGSYTPVALVIIGGWKGILIVVIQWTIVLVGILYKSLATRAMPKLSLTLYLVMGWIAIFFFPTLLRKANTVFLVLVVLGGVMYSIGAYFFAHDYKKYYHMIWHIFINIAAILHIIGIGFFLYRK
jgi:hemolysin III